MYTSSALPRRRWLSVAVVAATIAGSTLLSGGPARADESVVIPDAAFRACLASNLNPQKGPSDPLTAADLAAITDLACDGLGIADITGARYLENLQYLSAAGNLVADASELGDLGKLVEVNLAGNQLTTLDGVDHLAKVQQLYLSANALTSVEALADLDGPEFIDVSSNQISDLSPLGKFTQATVFADGQAWQHHAKVDAASTVTIKGRSGDAITTLTPAESWPSLTIAGAKVTASEAGQYDVAFTDPKGCAGTPDCRYTFSGTVTVVAADEFTDTPAPTISGKPTVGSTLTADTRDWTPKQLDWSYQWYRNTVAIPGAEASTYVVKTGDVGASIRVEVTGILDFYAAPAVSSEAVRVSGPEFTETPAPTITGTAVVGQTLTAHTSGWVPTPDEFEYQWYRNDTRIAGAEDDHYTVTVNDVGSVLKVVVKGEKAGYASVSATSLATDKVASVAFSTTPAPTISGTAAVGQTLTAVVSGWVPAPDAWAYQWYRGATRITGAQSSTYLVTPADAGSTLKVEVTGTKAGYAAATVSSAPTSRVPGHAFTRTTRPAISGSVKVGHTLTAHVSGWSPKPESWTYQWMRNGTAIPGATGATYRLVASDAGKRITVSVTGAKSGFTPASRTSLTTKKVSAGTFNTAKPSITGTAQVGATLTAIAPAWKPAVDSYHYQWLRDGKAIKLATAPTYKLSGNDAGRKITVRITGLKVGYKSAARTSNPTRRVLAGVFTAPIPTVTGEPKVGGSLAVVVGSWSPTPTSVHRQWYRDGVKILHATHSTYLVTTADLGHSITVKVTASRKGYTTVTRTSAALRVSA